MDENEKKEEIDEYNRCKLDLVRNIDFFIRKAHNTDLLPPSDIIGIVHSVLFDYQINVNKVTEAASVPKKDELDFNSDDINHGVI